MRRGKYTLRRRAEKMVETRRRIAQAALDLHATVGPAAATISAIAARAGVQRQTVYRHFPDDLSLFRACVDHGVASHPIPDPEPWRRIPDPEERLRTALGEVYAYYRRTEGIWANVTRDLPSMPALFEANRGLFDHWATLREVLAKGWEARGRRRSMLAGLVGHALDFPTWQSLVRRQGLTDDEAVAIFVRMVQSLIAK